MFIGSFPSAHSKVWWACSFNGPISLNSCCPGTPGLKPVLICNWSSPAERLARRLESTPVSRDKRGRASEKDKLSLVRTNQFIRRHDLRFTGT